MYFYHFTKYAGTDRVFSLDQDMGHTGDLVKLGEGEYGLCLGGDIARKEQTNYAMKTVKQGDSEIVDQGILGEKSLELLHWFVNEWYTTYKNSVPLWLHDIEDIIKRQATSGKQKTKKAGKVATLQVEAGRLIESDAVLVGQQLIIFPDLRTLEQYVRPVVNNLGSEVCILHGRSTKKQKSEAFWGIKIGTIQTLICTYSQIFQDWSDLQHIIVVDQHKRYYKHQQDPRYYVPTVVEKMAEAYGAKLVKTGMALASIG